MLRSDIYDRYYELFRLEEAKFGSLRADRISNSKFKTTFKTIRSKAGLSQPIERCATCGFPVSLHDVNTHKRFHVFFYTKFDKYKPFEDLAQAEHIRELAVELLQNEEYMSSLSDGLLISAVESLMLADYMKYLSLNMLYGAEYQSECRYNINIGDAMDVVSYTPYGYSWLCVNFRGLRISRTNVVNELMRKYRIASENADDWGFGVNG